MATLCSFSPLWTIITTTFQGRSKMEQQHHAAQASLFYKFLLTNSYNQFGFRRAFPLAMLQNNWFMLLSDF